MVTVLAGFGNLQVDDKQVDIHFDITHSPAEELLDDEDNELTAAQRGRCTLKPDGLLPIRELSERSFSSTSDVRCEDECPQASPRLLSRTLYVRGLSTEVPDDDLLTAFGKFGAIKRIRSQQKHRGFVIISYFDIRSAMVCSRLNIVYI